MNPTNLCALAPQAACSRWGRMFYKLGKVLRHSTEMSLVSNMCCWILEKITKITHQANKIEDVRTYKLNQKGGLKIYYTSNTSEVKGLTEYMVISFLLTINCVSKDNYISYLSGNWTPMTMVNLWKNSGSLSMSLSGLCRCNRKELCHYQNDDSDQNTYAFTRDILFHKPTAMLWKHFWPHFYLTTMSMYLSIHLYLVVCISL